jgi:hypothetical protein
MDLGGDLVDPAVLTAEEDRQHIGAAAKDQLGGEAAPFQLLGPTVEGPGFGDPAAREDDQHPAALQQAAGFGAGADIGLQRLPRAGEVDRQNMRPHLGGPVEDGVGHDHVIGALAGDEPAQDHAVDDAEGMIGDDGKGAARRNDPLRVAVEAQP